MLEETYATTGMTSLTPDEIAAQGNPNVIATDHTYLSVNNERDLPGGEEDPCFYSAPDLDDAVNHAVKRMNAQKDGISNATGAYIFKLTNQSVEEAPTRIHPLMYVDAQGNRVDYADSIAADPDHNRQEWADFRDYARDWLTGQTVDFVKSNPMMMLMLAMGIKEAEELLRDIIGDDATTPDYSKAFHQARADRLGIPCLWTRAEAMLDEGKTLAVGRVDED